MSGYLKWTECHGAHISADRGHLFTIRKMRQHHGRVADDPLLHYLTIALAGNVLYRRGFRTGVAARFAAEGFRKESPTFKGVA